MSSEPPDDGVLSEAPDFYRSTRMPLDAVVRLHFEGTVAYQNGFAANVSATGMYVKHPDPPALGTRLVFEFVLGDERKPVQGAGVVAWTREQYDGPGRTAGVGIQFTEVDALSRQHIAEALFAYLEVQLGEDLAGHPDIQELMASASPRTPLELAGESFREASAIHGADRLANPPIVLAPAAAAPESALPFRIFDDPDSLPTADDPGSTTSLFAPVVPPEELSERFAIGARRQERKRWPAIAIGLTLAIGGPAAWWFLLGPGSTPAPPPIVERSPEPTAPAPLRPTLDPQPGTATTLAQAVGADTAPAPEPLPVDSAAAAALAGPGEAVTVTKRPLTPITPPASAATAARASRVLAIDWEESGDLTVVVLTGDGGFPAGSFRWNEIRDQNPRVLLRLMPMASGYPKTLLAVGTPELKQLRLGYHEKPAGNELHIVLDLAAANVRVESVEASGSRLYVRLARP